MKIALAQQNYHIGNFEVNSLKIIAAIAEAKRAGADLVVFSELSVCGYPPRDFLEFDDFVRQSLDAVHRIAQETQDIAVLLGAPAPNPQAEGKNLFNAAYFLHNKEVRQVVHKTLLPTYDIFDEYRYFEPAKSWQLIPYKGKKLAVTICEDIWDLKDDPLYNLNPMDMLQKQGPDLMINLSASPFDYLHAQERKRVVAANVERYKLPMLYCNTVGSQTEIVFDGASLAMNPDGSLVAELGCFSEDFRVFELQDNGWLCSTEKAGSVVLSSMEDSGLFNPELHTDKIHAALILGIRDYFQKMGFDKAIVASSGGIDSAVVLALACEALGAGQVRALLMPSRFSTDHSVNDAVALSCNLKNPYDIVPIKDVFAAYENALEPLFQGLAFSVAEENLQSRIRGAMVMALSNKFGSILLNTSNKSELATGYGTLYGDMAGGLGVLGDLYKMQVYAMARYINRHGEIIPQHIIDKAPSAELRPGQKDSDSLPDYGVLDAILYQYIERRQGPKELLAMGFDPALVTRVLKLVNTNEYKRNQFCPIIRISPKAFGVGRRIPIVGKYLS